MANGQVTVQQSPGSIGFSGLLTITFVVLKLTHVIGWSWWWVLSPLWIPAAFWVLVLVIALVTVLIAKGVVANTRARKRARGRPRR